MRHADAVTREVVLPVPLEEAWSAVVDPDRLAEWLADEVELDELRPGAEAVFAWDDGTVRRAVLEQVDEPTTLAFRWSADDELAEESLVRFTLEEDADGTRLRVVEQLLVAVDARGTWIEGGDDWGPRMAALSGASAFALVA